MTDEDVNRVAESVALRVAEKIKGEASPWLKGDQAAADFLAYGSRSQFLKNAELKRIRPDRWDGNGSKFWSKSTLRKAREAGKI